MKEEYKHGTEPNHSAFPRQYQESTFGLTKREYFAVLALQGLLANPSLINNTAFDDAATAIQVADALIARLNEN